MAGQQEFSKQQTVTTIRFIPHQSLWPMCVEVSFDYEFSEIWHSCYPPQSNPLAHLQHKRVQQPASQPASPHTIDTHPVAVDVPNPSILRPNPTELVYKSQRQVPSAINTGLPGSGWRQAMPAVAPASWSITPHTPGCRTERSHQSSSTSDKTKRRQNGDKALQAPHVGLDIHSQITLRPQQSYP